MVNYSLNPERLSLNKKIEPLKSEMKINGQDFQKEMLSILD